MLDSKSNEKITVKKMMISALVSVFYSYSKQGRNLFLGSEEEEKNSNHQDGNSSGMMFIQDDFCAYPM